MKKSILLLHGWDYELYTKQTKDKNPWDYCQKLTNQLNENFDVHTLKFPGFCGEKEQKKAWDVEDFAAYVNDYITKNNLKIDIILGYSFGGAVAVMYKSLYKSKAKLFLVAPAIIRNFDNSKTFVKTPKIIQGLRNVLRNLYVSYVVKTPEMRFGTRFLKNTYQIIVRRDLRNELNSLDPDELMLLYGTKDDAVDPETINKTLPDKIRQKIVMLEGADHDNIVTDYVEKLMENLKKSLPKIKVRK